MKFLIAGLGSIGRRHFRNLLALGEREILLYRTHHATLPDDELSGFPVETDLYKALAHHPDAVIISNPTSLHLDVAIPAAQHGCHILLEKPVSHSMERVDELVQAVQQNRVKILVGFQFHFHPGLIKLKQLLDAGSIGMPLSARAHWGEYLPSWHAWEDYKQGYAARPELGGGVVLTLSQPLDYLRWFLGDVESLWAFVSHKGLSMSVEDLAEIGLRFKNGGVAGKSPLLFPEHGRAILAKGADVLRPILGGDGAAISSALPRVRSAGTRWPIGPAARAIRSRRRASRQARVSPPRTVFMALDVGTVHLYRDTH